MFLNALTLFWVVSSILIPMYQPLLSFTTYFALRNTGYLVKKIYLYGKLQQSDENNTKTSVPVQEKKGSGDRQIVGFLDKLIPTAVPKCWFSHFYIFGSLVHMSVLSLLIFILLGNPLPYFVRNLLRWIRLGNIDSSLNDNGWPLLIVLALEFVQILKRMYECLFVSTFSKSTMSIIHYFYGIFLYATFGIGLLSSVKVQKLVFTSPGAVEIACYFLGACLYSWGAFYQHKSMHTFASLRKNTKGHRPDDHYIPSGHLFEWVSCPHYFTEIIIYISYCLIFQFSNTILLSVALFVCTNQIFVSMFVHKWYQEHFPNYPLTRKAVIPYIL